MGQPELLRQTVQLKLVVGTPLLARCSKLVVGTLLLGRCSRSANKKCSHPPQVLAAQGVSK